MRPDEGEVACGIRVLPGDEKSVPPTYAFDAPSRALLARAHGHPQGFVVLRSWREKVATFEAARRLESEGLVREVLATRVDGEQTRVYRLTPEGEEVARVVDAS